MGTTVNKMSRQLAAVLLLFVGMLQAQSHPLRSGTHFGVSLPPKVLALWDEVSAGYGKTIREETMDFSVSRSYGFSDVDENGTPFIRLSEPGRSKENIAHELMHLKLRLEGYPFAIGWTGGCTRHVMIRDWLRANLKDPIEHWIFYPRIRALGITPDPELKRDIAQAIQRGSFAWGNNLTTWELATFYFRALTLPKNGRLRRKMLAWYRRKGWTQAMQLGDQMFGILTDVRPSTPDEEMTVFLRCANTLFKDEISFRGNGWTTLTRGRVVLRVFNVEVVPLVPCSL
jgi:hypothetical protein